MINVIFNAIAATIIIVLFLTSPAWIAALARLVKRFTRRFRARAWARKRTDFKGVVVRAWLTKSAFSTSICDIEVELEYLKAAQSEYTRVYSDWWGTPYYVEICREISTWGDVDKVTSFAIEVLKHSTVEFQS